MPCRRRGTASCGKFIAWVGVVMRCAPRILVVLLSAFIFASSGLAQSRGARHASSPVDSNEADIRDRLNAWTIGLAGGLLEGAPIHFATQIAPVVNEGGEKPWVP